MRHICRFWATCPVHCKSGRPPKPQPTKPKKKPQPHNTVIVSSVVKPSYNCSLYKTKLSLIRIHRGFQEFKGEDGKHHNCVRLVHGRLQVCRNLTGSSVMLIEPTKQPLNSKVV